jgi:hypothetical protein
MSRGWTYIERYCSKRRLFMNLPNLILICESAWQSSTGETWLKEARNQTNLHNLQALDRDGLLEHWSDVAYDYSKLSFTFSQDVLAASSGLAKIFAQQLQSDHVAGIWTCDLVRGLAWQYSRAQFSGWENLASSLAYRQITRLADYFAPSWSWADQGPILFLKKSKRQLRCDAVISAIADAGDPHGRSLAAELRLTCRTYDIGPWTSGNVRDFWRGEYLSICPNNDVALFCFFAWPLDKEASSVEGRFKLTLLGEYTTSWHNGAHSIGLILHEAQQNGSYYRVGSFETNPGDDVDKVFDDTRIEKIVVI